jgi:hypothetical protein
MPDITLDMGGISIGGGWNVTYGDVVDIVNEGGGGGDCPDPCKDVDYDRISEIVYDELDSKFPPGRPSQLLSSVSVAANSDTIVLPEFTEYVTLQMVQPGNKTPEQFGGDRAPQVFYNGWYSFGCDADSGRRENFNYNRVSVPCPAGAKRFSFTITYGGTARATVSYRAAV